MPSSIVTESRWEFSQRIFREQFHLVRGEVRPNCAGGRYSGKQVDYIRAEAWRRTAAIVDCAVRS